MLHLWDGYPSGGSALVIWMKEAVLSVTVKAFRIRSASHRHARCEDDGPRPGTEREDLRAAWQWRCRDFGATSEKDLVATLELQHLERLVGRGRQAKKAGAGSPPFSIQYRLFAL
jgi:hypothetical protein